jgi:hypothetical protein
MGCRSTSTSKPMWESRPFRMLSRPACARDLFEKLSTLHVTVGLYHAASASSCFLRYRTRSATGKDELTTWNSNAASSSKN